MNVLLDLDGTLTDPGVGIVRCVQYALETLGRPVPSADALHWCIGPPLKDAFATMFGPDQSDLIRQGVFHFRERFGSVGLFENEVYPEIPSVLEALVEAGHTLHVATSKPKVFADRLMDHFSLGRFFSSVHGSELDGTRSNKEHLIAHLLAVQGIAAESSIMVGDRMHDIIGARANQVKAIGVLWGYGTEQEFRQSGASVWVNTPLELPGAIQKLNERSREQ